jgi:SAM-dependent methyltransferase
MTNEVNSVEYWNSRFDNDWEVAGGRAQSRFFAALALRMMPAWLKIAIRQRALSVCDWGCGLGDGTDVLASALATDVTGVDFSDAAIANAVSRYPLAEFISSDILSAPLFRRWDIVFSSNTLEHFRSPWEVLQKVSELARLGIVILIPYREIDLDKEHNFTFLDDNIPLSVDCFRLTYCKIVDAVLESDSCWRGEQILLVYLSETFSNQLDLTLADVLPYEWQSKAVFDQAKSPSSSRNADGFMADDEFSASSGRFWCLGVAYRYAAHFLEFLRTRVLKRNSKDSFVSKI